MNGNSDHNKPLDREALLKLLEAGAGQESLGEGFDEFEKDALEGFSKHAPAGKARQLTEEIDTRIHERLREKEAPRSTGKIVWMAIAALLILVLAFSFYFLLQRNSDIHTELALKEAEEEKTEQQLPLTAEPVLPPQASDAAIAGNKQTETQKQEQPPTATGQERSPETIVMSEKKALKTRKADSDEGLEKSVVQTLKDKEPYASRQAETMVIAKDEALSYDKAPAKAATNTANSMPVQSQQEETSATVLTLSKEAASPTYESVSVATTRQKTKTSFPSKKAPAGTATDQSMGGIAGKTEDEARDPDYKAGVPAYTEAVFPGGTEVLKNEVIDWLKNHKDIPGSLRGTYHVWLRVFADGTAKVEALRAGYGAEAAGTAALEKALNGTAGWKPALRSGEVIASSLEFDLSF